LLYEDLMSEPGDNPFAVKQTPPANNLTINILAVWLLNLVPGIGLGVLYVGRLRALPLLFVIWTLECMFFRNMQFHLSWVYFGLSAIGTLWAIANSVKSAELEDDDEVDRQFRAAVGQMSGGATIPGADADDVRLSLHSKSPDFDIDAGEPIPATYDGANSSLHTALPSFERKIKEAEMRLAEHRMNATNDDEDLADARGRDADEQRDSPAPISMPRAEKPFVGSASAAEEAAMFGPDPFADETAAAAALGQAVPWQGANDVAPSMPMQPALRTSAAEEAAMFGPDPFADETAAAAALAQAVPWQGANEVAPLMPAQPELRTQELPSSPVPQRYGNVGSPAVSSSTSNLGSGPVPAKSGNVVSPILSSVAANSSEPELSPMFDKDFAAETANLLAQADAVAFNSLGDNMMSSASQSADDAAGKASAFIDALGSAVQNTGSDPNAELGKIHALGEVHELGAVPANAASSIEFTMPSYTVSDLSGSLGSVDSFTNSSAPTFIDTIVGAAGQASNSASTSGSTPDKKLCPKCGADLQGQFSFCLSCLSPL
jgi:hypothetical protein